MCQLITDQEGERPTNVEVKFEVTDVPAVINHPRRVLRPDKVTYSLIVVGLAKMSL